MLDPSSEDITARALETLDRCGSAGPTRGPARSRSSSAKQERDGTWYGRWGVNYIYGTWLALGAARAAKTSKPRYQRAGGVAALGPERGRRLGRAAALLRRPVEEGPGPEHGVADRVGADGAHRRAATDSDVVRRGIDYLLPHPERRRLLVGTRTGPAPASPRSSTCAIIFTRRISRCWRCRSTARRHGGRRGGLASSRAPARRATRGRRGSTCDFPSTSQRTRSSTDAQRSAATSATRSC